MSEHNDRLDHLETEYIDKLELDGTIDLIAEICSAKADHIRSNWHRQHGHDDTQASDWDDAAELLLECGYKINV